MFHFILYKSQAILSGDINQETVDIAKLSFSNNRRDGVTGFLHAEYGVFYQYLEGRKEVVKALFQRIQSDKRYSSVNLIASGESEDRLLTDFDMGFSSARGRKISDGFNEEPNEPPAQIIIRFFQEARDELSAA